MLDIKVETHPGLHAHTLFTWIKMYTLLDILCIVEEPSVHVGIFTVLEMEYSYQQ